MTLPVKVAGCALALTVVAGCSSDGSEPANTGSPAAAPGGDVDRVPGQVIHADSAAVSPDGERLSAGCLDDLCVWETGDGSISATYDGGSVVAWSPDGTLLATDGLEDNQATVVLLDADTGHEVRTMAGHDVVSANDAVGVGITALAFSPEGDVVASAGHDGTVRLWSVDDGSSLGVLETAGEAPDAIAFSPDGARLAVAAPDAAVEVWDVDGASRVGTLDAEPAGDVAWGQDVLATASNAPGSSATVHRWDPRTLREQGTFPGQVQAYRLAFSPDGTTLAMTQKEDDAVLLWPVDGDDVRRLTSDLGEPPRAVLWAPDGGTLYSVSSAEGVIAWNPATGQTVRTFDLPEE